MRLMHVSDIHHQVDWRARSWASSGVQGLLGRIELHGFGRLARFSEAATKWARILEDVAAHAPDHVLLTGDLTAMGHPDELAAMHEMLRPLLDAGRLTLVPGNHDRYVAPRAFERVFEAHLASDLPELADAHGYPFVKLLGDDVALVGLDSTRVVGWSQYFVGRLGAAQLAALGRVLEHPRVVGRTVHVLSHHGPLSSTGRREWLESALIDGPELLAALHGREVVLHHGHSHVRSWHRAEAQRPHLFGGGSSTEPGREGYWLLDVEDHRELEARHLRPGHR
jgi:3',5'-cyclic AMP phosphodiesterase CpdA